MGSRGRSKISASEASPISTSSASVSDDTRSVFGPANQPVSTGWPGGCCVHHVGTVASVPYPISAMAAVVRAPPAGQRDLGKKRRWHGEDRRVRLGHGA